MALNSATVEVGGATLHYVRGGSGPTVVLLHGFPQDWYEWHDVMPHLAKNFTVIAVDLPGIGGSTATDESYDSASVAEKIFQLTQELGIEQMYLAGHDIGGLVSYAFARLHPETLRGLMILDVPVIGIPPEPEARKSLFHIELHQMPDIPERLIAGREAAYFRWFFDSGTGRLQICRRFRAGTLCEGLFLSRTASRRAADIIARSPESEAFNVAQTDKIDVPLVLTSGDTRKGFGAFLPDHAKALKRLRLVERLRRAHRKQRTLLTEGGRGGGGVD